MIITLICYYRCDGVFALTHKRMVYTNINTGCVVDGVGLKYYIIIFQSVVIVPVPTHVTILNYSLPYQMCMYQRMWGVCMHGFMLLYMYRCYIVVGVASSLSCMGQYVRGEICGIYLMKPQFLGVWVTGSH